LRKKGKKKRSPRPKDCTVATGGRVIMFFRGKEFLLRGANADRLFQKEHAQQHDRSSDQRGERRGQARMTRTPIVSLL